MGEDEVVKTIVTMKTITHVETATDPIDFICFHTALLLREHMLKVGYERPTTIGVEEEHGRFDSNQKVTIIAETPVEN